MNLQMFSAFGGFFYAYYLKMKSRISLMQADLFTFEDVYCHESVDFQVLFVEKIFYWLECF